MKYLKLILLYTLLFLVPYVTLGQKVALDGKEGTIVLKGKIGRINAPQQLWVYMGNEQWDSIPLKDGVFEYRKTTILPAYGALMVKYKPYYKDVEGHTNFFGDMDLKSIYFEEGMMTVESPTDSINGVAKISGSEIHDSYERFLVKRKAISIKEKEIAARLNNATPEQLQSDIFLANYEKEMATVYRHLDSLIISEIKERPSSLVSQLAFLAYLRAQESVLQSDRAMLIFDLFHEDFKNSPTGKSTLDYIQSLGKPKPEFRILGVGDTAPLFTQTSLGGEDMLLSDFTGKYVLLDFWASWCLPCRKVNPDLVKLYHKYKGKGFEILGISLDEDKGKWEEAIKSDSLSWQQVSDLKGWKNEVAELYGISAIPQSFLVDPQGKIVAKNLKGEELDKKLEELLR